MVTCEALKAKLLKEACLARKSEAEERKRKGSLLFDLEHCLLCKKVGKDLSHIKGTICVFCKEPKSSHDKSAWLIKRSAHLNCYQAVISKYNTWGGANSKILTCIECSRTNQEARKFYPKILLCDKCYQKGYTKKREEGKGG